MDTPHAALAAALGQQQPAALESVAAMLARLTAAVDAQPKDSDVLGRIASLEDSHRRTQDRATQLAARVAVLQAAVERLEADNKRLSAEWDRMPAEIQNKILDAASPFTKFVNGLLLAAELRALPDKQREQVWQDANDVDWQGDVKSLPSVDIASRSLSMSRWLVERLRGRHIEKNVARVMVRNGWTDMFDFEQPEALDWAAASEGDVDLLRELIDVRRAVEPERGLLTAADQGQIGILKLLHQRAPCKRWLYIVGEGAARTGNRDLLAWIHKHHPESLGEDSANSAAMAGHVTVVRWLVGSVGIACNRYVLESVAQSNDLGLLQFLFERFPDGDDDLYLSQSFSFSHLKTAGELDILKWAVAHYQVDLSENDIIGPVLVEWWRVRYGVVFGQRELKKAIQDHNVKMVLHLLAADNVK
ncbi:hypothetical protein HK105_208270 [Polyrhizophydium stewartii]|uniref:Ankyrin repeat protein n=1 Tax=Polyrhizophydium stewartii TaxID=2732419 RepID=A0ABR4MYF6_9FUNG